MADLTTPKPPLLGCPFCGAAPHWSLSKMMGCQLHGEPYQYRIIACPKRHAQISALTNADAARAWNTRVSLSGNGDHD